MNSLKPTNISASRQARQLTITWNDGHTSIYPFSLLRNACPCASCRGGHDKMSSTPDPQVFSLPILDESPRAQLRKIEAVGAYAISLEWEDDHNFGIYTWSYLRALCPCPVCRPQDLPRRHID